MIKAGVTTGVWHHFAIVRTGTMLNFYLNGGLAGSDSDFIFTFDPAKPLKLGGVSTATSVWDRWLHGGLADFGVFSAALIPTEITRLATGPIANLAGQSNPNTVSLTVNPPVSSPYETWLGTRYPDIPDHDRLPSADPDDDGVTNLIEFALNGDPTDSSNRGFIASVIQDSSPPAGNELTLVFAVRSGAIFAAGPNGEQTATMDGITYTVEGSLDLSFPGAVVTSTATSTTGLPGLAGTDWEYHTFTLDASEGLTTRGFIRLKVTQP